MVSENARKMAPFFSESTVRKIKLLKKKKVERLVELKRHKGSKVMRENSILPFPFNKSKNVLSLNQTFLFLKPLLL